jgi:hypothetical protein
MPSNANTFWHNLEFVVGMQIDEDFKLTFLKCLLKPINQPKELPNRELQMFRIYQVD